jgi:malate dehydrogenase (oxaloacetate-decarboxylating)
MAKELSKEELIEKAKKPGKDAIKLHPFYRGKIQMTLKCAIRDFNDFAIWYTPGVAEPCKDIVKDPKKVWEYTNRGNTVAVVTDGTRILGLGDIGPEAGLPVMEGKALLYKYLGGVDAFPICLGTKDPYEFIRTVKILEPSFGGINLEDIEQPKCFYILERLRNEMQIPVWHDDQQGTATVVLAALLNALKIVGKNINSVKVAMIGAGASNTRGARLLIKAGVRAGNIIMVDSKGILHRDRKDLEEKKNEFPDKWEFCLRTNEKNKKGGIKEALEGADVCIAASKPGPDVIKKEWIKMMNKNPIVFACANPIPEIWPWDAKEAGAKVVATGRSDFPNQVNNSLGFPGIFRGALDVRAYTITDEMCIAAAYELAKVAEDKGLSDDYIIPNMDQWEVFPREAVAVGMKAIEQEVARVTLTKEELYYKAESTISKARGEVKFMMEKGFIPLPKE